MKKWKVLIPVTAGLFMLSAFTTNYGKQFEITKNIEIYTNVYKELNSWYVDDLDPNTLMRIGINAMVGSLDPFTNYFTETQVEGYRFKSEGQFDGVGAVVEMIDGVPTITKPFENSPAIKAGLKAGDQILTINGEPTADKNKEQVSSILRGSPGTEALLTVKRPGSDEELNISLVRGDVQVRNVPYSGLVADGIGYIVLTTFTFDAGRNVSNALRDLKTENPDLRGVILDLRGNGGGLLREAVNVCNIFIPKNEEVVSTRGKVKERDQVYRTKGNPVDGEIPLVVMINKSSASASEIVSGVMQDLDRGVLIGQRSYGKGLVQNTRDVGYNAQIKMTTAKYYIPSGRCIQGVAYENGEPKDIPDDERTEFKTRNGRTVLDGGGVKPDVLIDKDERPVILKQLDKEHHIFKFVTDYCIGKDSIAAPEEFAFTKFDAFERYLKDAKFTFDTPAEKRLQELTKRLEKNKLDSQAKNELSTLAELLEDDKATHLERYQDEIIKQIEMDIAGRYYYQNGQTRQRLKNDEELDRAIALLNNPEEYAAILK